MRTTSKKVYLKSYVPFNEHPGLSVPWIDVWVWYFVGRKKIRQMLTLKWSGELDKQISFMREQNAHMRERTKQRLENPPPKRTEEEKAEDEAKGIYRFEPDWEPKIEWYEDQNTEVIDLQWAKRYFENHPEEEFCIDNMSHDMEGSRIQIEHGYFYILVNRPQLAKKDIEDAIKWYLNKEKDLASILQGNYHSNKIVSCKKVRSIKPKIRIRWKSCKQHIWPV